MAVILSRWPSLFFDIGTKCRLIRPCVMRENTSRGRVKCVWAGWWRPLRSINHQHLTTCKKAAKFSFNPYPIIGNIYHFTRKLNASLLNAICFSLEHAPGINWLNIFRPGNVVIFWQYPVMLRKQVLCRQQKKCEPE